MDLFPTIVHEKIENFGCFLLQSLAAKYLQSNCSEKAKMVIVVTLTCIFFERQKIHIFNFQERFRQYRIFTTHGYDFEKPCRNCQICQFVKFPFGIGFLSCTKITNIHFLEFLFQVGIAVWCTHIFRPLHNRIVLVSIKMSTRCIFNVFENKS